VDADVSAWMAELMMRVLVLVDVRPDWSVAT
jgi:hypothetical protein